MKRIKDRENINTKEYWNKEYEQGKYDNHLKVRLKFYGEVCRRLEPGIKKLLDIGCATGYGLNLIRKNFPDYHLYGFDISEIACAKARDIVPYENIYCMDIVANGFIPPKFCEMEYVTIVQTLEHLENPKNIIERCLFICKKLIITVPYKKQGYKTNEHIITGFDENSFNDFEVIKVETIRKGRNLLAILKGLL